MDNLLIIIIVTIAAGTTGWFYWQTQKAEQRITNTAAQLVEQAGLIGEMVDEVFAAGQNLYAEMDRWQVIVDKEMDRNTDQDVALISAANQGAVDNSSAAPSHAVPASPTKPAERLPVDLSTPSIGLSDEAQISSATTLDYTPHLEALRLAADGASFVDIARSTGIGTEELRLLLSFQEAVNNPAL